MNERDRFVACLLGEPADRPPYLLYWDPWPTTWARWEKEGKPEDVTDHRTVFEAEQFPLIAPINCGPCPKVEKTVLEEDDEFVIYLDRWGVKRRDFKHKVSMSEFIEFPVKNRRDWEQFKEEKLDPDHPDRLSGNWREVCAEWMQKGWPIQLGDWFDVGLFGSLRWLLGDEECLVAFYSMPDLVHDIMDHLTTLYLNVFSKVVMEVRFDVLQIWEDMCYRGGPLFSPKHWDEFIGLHYRRLSEFARQHDIPLVGVDTDGYVDPLLPNMIRDGVNFLQPLEVAARGDVNVLQDRFPTLGMLGGIDKRALARGPEAIDRELERVRPAVEKGRYIPELDHAVPDDVPWENYRYYAEALKKMVGKV